MECRCERCERCIPHFKPPRTILQSPCSMERATNARARAYCEQHNFTCVAVDNHWTSVVERTAFDFAHNTSTSAHYDKCVRTVGWEISLKGGGPSGFNVGDLFESLFAQACDAQNRVLVYYPGSFFVETSRDFSQDLATFHLTGSFGVLRATNQ